MNLQHLEEKVPASISDPAFDYSNSAIAFRAMQVLTANPQTRHLVHDAIWSATSDRALFLLHRLCCALDATAIRTELETLQRLVQGMDCFVSITATPDPRIIESFDALLGLLGFGLPEELSADPPDAAADALEWSYDAVVAQMRRSRTCGGGSTEKRLSARQDAIRRLNTVLIANGHLKRSPHGGPKAITSHFGAGEIKALAAFVCEARSSP